MNKQLVIYVKDSRERGPLFECSEDGNIYLHGPECRNIMRPFENVDISTDDMINAIDLIITHMVRDNLSEIVVDIAEHDQALAPPKEMTLKEIEKELGYKVKIVSKEE